jgi:hypothetical protein
MTRKLVLLPALLSLLLSVPARGADGWARLKLGMTAEEAEAALGAPLIRNEGRGFELWIYDSRAEVVFYGGIVAWTAPSSAPAVPAPKEVWEFYQAIPNHPRDRIPLRKRAPSPREDSPVAPDLGSDFRYLRRR